jgi:thiamine-phosphate pyrophosphorylase
MRRRQTIPSQWLILLPDMLERMPRLPRGTGVLLIEPMKPRQMRHLRRLGRQRDLLITEEGRDAARVHNVRELRQAMLRRTPLILLSPIHRTRSHPNRRPLPRMRAAALARLGKRRLIALGGMNERRYANVAPLGFIAWAGISAFRI